MLVLARANLEGLRLIHRGQTGRAIAGHRCYRFLGLKSSTKIFDVLRAYVNTLVGGLVYLLRLVNNLLQPCLRSGLFNSIWNTVKVLITAPENNNSKLARCII